MTTLDVRDLDPEVLWRIVKASENIWPAYRRALVLDAYGAQEGGIPLDRLGEYHYLRGDLLYELGEYAEGLEDCQKALEIVSAEQGQESVAASRVVNLQALLYLAQGRYAEAEPLCQRTLRIVEQALGEDHPHVATCLENYADLLRATDRPDEAEKLEERARAIRERHTQLNPTPQ